MALLRFAREQDHPDDTGKASGDLFGAKAWRGAEDHHDDVAPLPSEGLDSLRAGMAEIGGEHQHQLVGGSECRLGGRIVKPRATVEQHGGGVACQAMQNSHPAPLR